MKKWEEMTSRERVEITYRDIKKRQQEREKGQQQAKAFVIERAIRQSRIAYKAKNRGCRGCK